MRVHIRSVLLSLAVGMLGMPEAFASSDACDRSDGVPSGTLVATRSYHPPQSRDDARALDHPTWFFVPLAAHVLTGQSGPHLATLSWRGADGAVGACAYLGTGTRVKTTTCTGNGDEYRLTLCTVIDSSGFTFFGAEGLIRAATAIRFHLWGGDSCAPTTASVDLTSPPDTDADGVPDCLEPPSPDTTPPQWPAGSELAATVTGTAVTLAWTPATDNVGVTRYRVYQDDAIVEEVDGATVSALLAGLSPNVAHSFQVQAVDAAGNASTDGPTASAIIDTLRPSWPPDAALSIVPQGLLDAIVSWPAAADAVGVVAYRVFEDDTLVGTVDGLSFHAGNLDPSHMYAFRVEAIDAAGNESVDGPTATFRIDVDAPIWPPGSAVAASVAGSTATLVWTSAIDNVAVAGYRVFQDGQLVAETDAGTLSAHITSLAPNVPHRFQVQALDRAGNLTIDGPATTVRIDTIAPTWPDGAVLAATREEPSVVALAWPAASDEVAVAGYRVFENGQPIFEVGPNGSTATVSGLDPTATYTFQVQAFDAAGNISTTGPSATVGPSGSAPTWPDDSELVAFPHGTNGTVDLIWGPAEDDVAVVAYEIFLDGLPLLPVTDGELAATVAGVTLGAHRFEIEALDADGNRSPRLAVDTELETVPPTWPPGSVVTAGPAGLLNVVALAWTPAFDNVGVTSYGVLRNGNIVAVSTEPASVVVVLNSATATFQIVAIDANDNLAYGPSVTVTIDRVPPVWPAGTRLVARSPSPGVTTLQWTPASDASGILRYTIYRDGSAIGQVDGATLAFDVAGLDGSRQYTFQIKAQDEWGNVSTGDPTYVLRVDHDAPTWPPGSTLVATQVGSDAAMLMWTPAVDNIGVAAYWVLRDGSPPVEIDGGLLFARIDGLIGQTYRFQVQAVDARGNVGDGPVRDLPFDRSPPVWPPGSALTASAQGTGAALAWTPAIDDVGVDRYLVYVDGVAARAVAAPALSTVLLDLAGDADHVVKVEAVDRAGNRTTTGPSAQLHTAPAGPPLVAPPLDPTVTTTVYQSTAFLYTGDNPVQRGVPPGTITRERAALVRGHVRGRDGHSIAGVTVSVLDHPEYGNTDTRGDGQFSLAVNGGAPLVLAYAHPDYLTAQRRVDPSWKQSVQAPEVVLVPIDPEVTEVASGATGPQVARGSVQEDADGARQATLIFPSEMSASMTLPDGTSTPLPTFHVRATEYTVGPSGPKAMPAPLPPASAYTYAVELSADEARAAGATRVTFDKPIPLYVDNFLGFDVGETVPLGYYDFGRGVWVAADSGRVVQIVGAFLGLAQLDANGDGAPDSDAALAQLGVTGEERAELAALYPVGTSLWRVTIDHFTPWDVNWAGLLPLDAETPEGAPKRVGGNDARPCRRPGSIVSCQTRTLGERVPIAGTGVALHYQGERTQGRTADRHLRIPLTGASVPATLGRVHLEVDVAGQHHEADYAPAANQTADFVWDGRDGYGRAVQGSSNARVKVSYRYPVEYARTFRFGSVGTTGTGVVRSEGGETELSAETTTPLGGFLSTPANSVGGWAPTGQAALDPTTGIVYHADGRVEHTATGRATLLSFGPPDGFFVNTVVPDPLGGVYFIGHYGGAVWHVTREATLELVAGNQHVRGFAGDGGPATEAWFCGINGMALAPDGSIYLLDAGFDSVNIPSCRPGGRVRRIGPDGIVTTIAGTGANVTSGEGGPAIEAGIAFDSGSLVLGVDGSLSLGTTNYGIRRIGTDGRISKWADVHVPFNGGSAGGSWLAPAHDGSIYYMDPGRGDIYRATAQGGRVHVAGTGELATQPAPSGDQALATTIAPWALAVGPDDTLYFAEALQFPTLPTRGGKVRKIDRDGKVVDVADGGCQYATGRGSEVPALTTAGRGCWSSALAVGLDGTFYFGGANAVVRAQPLDGVDWASGTLLSTDGLKQYVFDADGRHLRTQDPLTGATRLGFGYDSLGRLSSIVDGDGNAMTVGYPSPDRRVVTAPVGQVTQVGLNADGLITSVTNPAGDTVALTYERGDLLASLSDPLAGTSTFTYDADGLLQRDTSAGGGYQELVAGADGSVVTRTTRMGRTSAYETATLPDGRERRRVTGSDGLTTEMVEDFDHTKTLAYPNGSRLQLTQAPDPLLGVRALNTTGAVFTTPAGRNVRTAASVTYQRGADADPAHVQSVTVQTTFNGARRSSRRYDAATRTIATTSPAGRVTQTIFDDRGRAATVIVPGVLPVSYTYDALGRAKTITQGERQVVFDYDAAGNVSTVTAPSGEQTHTTYDVLGRPLAMTRPDGRMTTFAYEHSGRRFVVTPPGKPGHVGEVSPEAQTSRYEPPQVGDVSSQRAAQLDDDGLVSTSTYGLGAAALVVTVVRDGAGRAVTVTSPRGAFTYAYTADGHIDAAATPEGVSTHFTFDGPLLNGITMAGPVTGQIGYSYDADLRPSGQTVNGSSIAFTYDADNFLLTAGELTLARDASSGFVQHASVHNVGWTFGRNAYGDIDDREATYGETLFWATHVACRDANGRVLERQESVGGQVHTFDYSYDGAGRLTDVVIDGIPREHYEYDENGNRLFTTRPVGDADAEYDVQDRVVRYGNNTYAHSPDGALVRKADAATGAATLYNYDLAGNLLQVTLPSGDVIEYIVDADGRRVARKLNGTFTHRWVYAGEAGPAAEVDAQGLVLTRFVYGTRPWVPAYMTRGGRTYALVTDALGSVRLVVDADSGAIAQELVYDTFGVVVRDTNPGFQPFGFAGGLYDPATGLVRLGARDYDADTGRWTTKDPLLFGGGDSNVYAYVGNDPVNRIDPAGLSIGSWLSDLWLGATISVDNILNGREDPLVDSIAGFGDTLSLGLTAKIRGALGLGGFVNPCSGDYHRGSIGGTAYGALAFVTGAIKALAARGFFTVAEGGAFEANAPTLNNLGRQLATEEASSAFTATGELSPDAIQGARQIIAPGELGNPNIPQGFAKYATETFRSPSGPFQIHFYKNPMTGEVFYGLDYKAVLNNGIVPYSVGGP